MHKFLIVAATLFVTACAAPPTKNKPATTPETVNAAPAKPSKPKITSQQLLGQNGPWVKDKLGEPSFVRAERSANIWQYKHGHCVLNVFLYAQNEYPPKVLHFDARTASGGNTDRDTCLAVLQD